jgi:recombination DNA repair RAD52 pathway protein
VSLRKNQTDQLLKGINPSRVGKDGKGFAHLEAWDVRAHLIRIFGFAKWSAELVELEPIFETSIEKDGKTRWTVAYRATMRLTIYTGDLEDAIYTEAAVGDSQNNPSRADAHDMAIKTAESQAFKRCAINLGDQFGLSLYNNGGTSSVVRAVLDAEESREEEPVVEVVKAESSKPASKKTNEEGLVQQQLRRVNILGKPVDDGSE